MMHYVYRVLFEVLKKPFTKVALKHIRIKFAIKKYLKNIQTDEPNAD